MAVAQKNTVNIYDENGVELHCLDNKEEIMQLEFIKLAWLLASMGYNKLHYKDVSTGKNVSVINYRDGLAVPKKMAINEWNGVTLIGDTRGTVSMWAPTHNQFLMKILACKGPVEDVKVDKSGNYLIVSGLDRTVRIFDVRKGDELECFSTGSSHAPSIALSQKNTLALATQTGTVKMYQDIFNLSASEKCEPYLYFHRPHCYISDLQFVPYEDVLGIGHSKGFSSILVPGSGEPNFDTFVDNPFMKTKQLREHVVSSLLTKVQPEMIQLEPDFIGKFIPVDDKQLWKDQISIARDHLKKWKPKRKKKSKQNPSQVNARKQLGRWDKQRDLIKEVRDQDLSENKVRQINQQKLEENNKKFGSALGRFAK